MSPFSMAWRIVLFVCASGLSGARTWPDALIPCLAAGVIGLLLDRRLRQTFPEGVSLLATLALITASKASVACSKLSRLCARSLASASLRQATRRSPG